MNIELRQLQYFVEVAEQLHFRRSAERLFISQPTLSHQIANLEKALGVKLLDRDRRSVALTDAGAVLLEDARRLLARLDQTVAHVRWTAGQAGAGLRVGFPGYGASIVRQLLEAFRRESPHIWIDAQGLDILSQTQALRAGTLDVGFIRPPADAGLAVEPLLAQDLVVAVPAAHWLARVEEVPLRGLAGAELLMPPEHTSPGYHAYVTALCRLAGFRPKFVQLEENEPFNLGSLLPLVAEGRGLALLAMATSRGPHPRVEFRPVKLPNPLYRLALAWRHDSPSPHVKAFVDFARRAAQGPS
jgi:DNA-binding transcriptional LysR family regulator